MLDILQTERLLLRPPEPRDATAFTVHLADYDIAKMMARVPYPYRRSDALAFLAKATEMWAEAKEYPFVVARKEDSYCIGAMGLSFSPIATITDTLELGYWLAKPYWGQGLASEAAAALLTFAFERLKLAYVVAGHAKDNPASGRVLQKLGFVRTGEAEVHSLGRGEAVLCERYALTRDGFMARVL